MMDERVHYKKLDREIQNLKENFTKEELFDFYKERLGDKYYVGQKVGKLTVEEPFRVDGTWWYVCRCECGNTKNVKVREMLTLKYPMCAKCSKKERDAITTNKYDLTGEYGIGWDSDGNEFWFDLEDYDKIKNISWHKSKSGYFTGKIKGTNTIVSLCRVIYGETDPSRRVQHRTGNKYDHRKMYLESVVFIKQK